MVKRRRRLAMFDDTPFKPSSTVQPDLRRWAVAVSGEYPENWTEISNAAKAAAGYRCEHCDAEFEEGKNTAKEKLDRRGKPINLTLHHIDGNKSNNDWTNLLVCCTRCHLIIQWHWKPGDPLPARWQHAPRWMVDRGLEYKPSPQMRLFDDDES